MTFLLIHALVMTRNCYKITLGWRVAVYAVACIEIINQLSDAFLAFDGNISIIVD